MREHVNERQSGSIRPDVGSGSSDLCWLGEIMPVLEGVAGVGGHIHKQSGFDCRGTKTRLRNS